MHYLTIAIFKIDSVNTYRKIKQGLAKSKTELEYGLIDSLTKKLEKPFRKFNNHDDDNRKFDSWEITDVLTVEYALEWLYKMDRFPQAVFTTGSEWVEPMEYDMQINRYDVQSLEFITWRNRVKHILEKNKQNGIVAYIDCDA